MLFELRFNIESPVSQMLGFSGPLIRGAFLKMIRNHSPELSNLLHESQGVRLYSVDPLPFDRRFQTPLTEGEMYNFGVSILDSSGLGGTIQSEILKQDAPVIMQGVEFPLRSVDFKHYSKDVLWRESDRMTDRPLKIHMSFLTPTQLSQFGSGMAYLLPDPEKIFSSVLRLWNVIADDQKVEPISEYRQWIQKHVHISSHRIRTTRLFVGKNRSIIGFLGDVTFTLQKSKDPFASVTPVIAKFSEFTNIGKNRTAGLGKVSVRIN